MQKNAIKKLITLSSIKTKLIFRLMVLFFVLFVVISFFVFMSFRVLGIEAAKKEAKSIATITRDALTSFMLTDTIQHRAIFFDQMKHSSNYLNSVRVLRGTSVIKQHGPPLSIEEPENELEVLALSSGKIQERLIEDSQTVIYELAMPYIATSKPPLNCMDCHDANEGEVLGAVSIRIDISKYRQTGIYSFFLAFFVSLLFFIITVFIVVRFFTPYTNLFEELKVSFKKIQDGDFSNVIAFESEDEAGEVAQSANTMIEKLSNNLAETNKKISFLLGHKLKGSGNALKDTSEVVNELVQIYIFKRAIENDQTKEEVYKRIGDRLENLGVYKFSFYEVDRNENSMRQVLYLDHYPFCLLPQPNNKTLQKFEKVANLQVKEEKLWCQKSILHNANECRAKRTGKVINSHPLQDICPYFDDNHSPFDHYYCIPIYLNSGVNNIVQLVYGQEQVESMSKIIPFVKSYLQEATPVLEAKVYMDMLEKRSLIDELTGIYNRRFAEEFSQNISVGNIERQNLVGILMIDIDFFKKVNDEYGHVAGDQVLKQTAILLQQNIGHVDFVIRYGGEEFLVLLTEVENRKQVWNMAENLRKLVANYNFDIGQRQIQNHISIGFSVFPKDATDFWACVNLADKALYQAKKRGRNQVIDSLQI